MPPGLRFTGDRLTPIEVTKPRSRLSREQCQIARFEREDKSKGQLRSLTAARNGTLKFAHHFQIWRLRRTFATVRNQWAVRGKRTLKLPAAQRQQSTRGGRSLHLRYTSGPVESYRSSRSTRTIRNAPQTGSTISRVEIDFASMIGIWVDRAPCERR